MTAQSMELNDAAVTAQRDTRAIGLRQQLYWSLRRETWEHRSIWIAPLALAVFLLLAFISSLPALERQVAALHGPNPEAAHLNVHAPYGAMTMAMLGIVFLVGVFFCADALQGERRDRSVLFWKSLPISDATTVIAKFLVPLALLPLIAFSLALSLHLIFLTLSSIVLLFSGSDVALFVDHVGPIDFNLAALYAAAAMTLWHAPIYGWLLLVSALARRAAFVWATTPIVAVVAAEYQLYGTVRFFGYVKYMTYGWVTRTFDFTDPMTMLESASPMRLLSTPSLWIGLIFTAGCMAAAVYLRRHREPG
jgi:ABC-2 type transport system permease protein